MVAVGDVVVDPELCALLIGTGDDVGCSCGECSVSCDHGGSNDIDRCPGTCREGCSASIEMEEVVTVMVVCGEIVSLMSPMARGPCSVSDMSCGVSGRGGSFWS